MEAIRKLQSQTLMCIITDYRIKKNQQTIRKMILLVLVSVQLHKLCQRTVISKLQLDCYLFARYSTPTDPRRWKVDIFLYDSHTGRRRHVRITPSANKKRKTEKSSTYSGQLTETVYRYRQQLAQRPTVVYQPAADGNSYSPATPSVWLTIVLSVLLTRFKLFCKRPKFRDIKAAPKKCAAAPAHHEEP